MSNRVKNRLKELLSSAEYIEVNDKKFYEIRDVAKIFNIPRTSRVLKDIGKEDRVYNTEGKDELGRKTVSVCVSERAIVKLILSARKGIGYELREKWIYDVVCDYYEL